MTNADLSLSVLSALKRLGVKTFCVCPGSRNSPLVEALTASSDFEKLYFFDERAAGFFAAGRIRQTGKPAAVVTTSGTAVGELLPSCMEAYYGGLPLILVTADRPQRFRGTGAPQSAEQKEIFGVYVQDCVDLSVETKQWTLSWDNQKPLHLNVCFDEPLLDQSTGAAFKYDITETNAHGSVQLDFDGFKFPLFLIGGLNSQESQVVGDFLKHHRFLFYAEGPSQLREREDLKDFRLQNLDKIFERARENQYAVDQLIRVGDVPTHRIWRDLETKLSWPVTSISSKNFSGLTRSQFISTGLVNFFSKKRGAIYNSEKYASLKKEDARRQEKLNLLLEKDFSEAGVFRKLSQLIPAGSSVYLGNSMPIREWDLAATKADKGIHCFGSRGLNGIDGQLSYFFGSLESDRESWAIIGDLTALYDLQGPWILRQLKNPKFKIIIINNGGGKIFDRMYGKKEYLNAHDLRFKGWAEMFGLSYEQIGNHFDGITAAVTEIIPSPEAGEKFLSQYEKL